MFTTSEDDIFMRSVYTKYAIEMRDLAGKPTGQFYLTKADALVLATEVVGTHGGKKGAEAADYLAKVFDGAWNFYDVNLEGKIDVARAPPLMRTIVGNQAIDLHLNQKK